MAKIVLNFIPLKAKYHEIIRFFSDLDSGCLLFPGELAEKLKIPIEDSYELLESLSEDGFVRGLYEYRCGHCRRVLGRVHLFNELPSSIKCTFCGSTKDTLKNTIKIYEVL